MKKTLAIFAGSKDISDKESEKLKLELVSFFKSIKDKIDKIIYWWWDTGVMWIVYKAALKAWIPIKWYSLEKYREDDEWKEIEMKFYKNAEKRLEGFYQNWDLFLSLPWWMWTIEEILRINTFIKENKELKKIFIPIIFKRFYKLAKGLEKDNMVADEDKTNFVKVKKLKKIRV